MFTRLWRVTNKHEIKQKTTAIFYHGMFGIHGNKAKTKCGGFHFPAEKSYTAVRVFMPQALI
jgi:hypothetical protein